MPRKRVVQKTKSGKRWGVQNGTSVVRRRPDGSYYTEFRHPYYAELPVYKGTEIVTFDLKRLWAASSVSPADAKQKAETREREKKEFVDAYWKNVQIARGTKEPDPVPTAPKKPKRLTLVACAEEYISTRKRYRDGQVIGAQFGYRKKLDGYIKTLYSSQINKTAMGDLAPADVLLWFTESYMPDHAETTAARFKDWLVSVGTWGVKSKYWESNLFEILPTLSKTAKHKDLRVYSLDEIDAMWKAARTPQERALLVLLRVGLRQGECTALSGDMILNESTIEVRYTLGLEDNLDRVTNSQGKVTKTVRYLHPAKGSSGGRVHVPPAWMSYLREAVDLAIPDFIPAYDDTTNRRNLNPGHPIPRRFIVNNRFGRSWCDTSVGDALRALMKRAKVEAGITNQTFHKWRHALASDLFAMGCDEISVAYLMRHRDYNLSKSVYASARQEQLSDYKQFLDGINGPKDYIECIYRFDEHRRSLKNTC